MDTSRHSTSGDKTATADLSSGVPVTHSDSIVQSNQGIRMKSPKAKNPTQKEKVFVPVPAGIKHDLSRGLASPPGQSRLFDIYDQAPKFFSPYSKVELKISSYRLGGEEFEIVVNPMRLRADNREVLPGFREELVEKVVRYLALQNLDEMDMFREVFSQSLHAGTRLTLYQIRKELKRLGHELRIDQIKESLEILSKTLITLTKRIPGKKRIIGSSDPILTIKFNYSDTPDDDGKYSHVVIWLHPLACECILNLAYHPYNFDRILSLKNPLARWIATRMSHNYTQAAPGDHITGNGYTLSLDTVINQSGTAPLQRHRDYLPLVKKALAELVTADILYLPVAERKALNGDKWTPSGVDPVRKDKGDQIEEVTLYQPYLQRLFYRKAKTNPVFNGALWTLFPSESFAAEMKQSNRTVKTLLEASSALDCQATKDFRNGRSKAGQEAA